MGRDVSRLNEIDSDRPWYKSSSSKLRFVISVATVLYHPAPIESPSYRDFVYTNPDIPPQSRRLEFIPVPYHN